jgi:hypothetical protein
MEGFTYFRSDLLIGVDENSVTGAAFDMPGTSRIRLVLNCVTKDAPPAPQDLGTFEVTVTEATGDDQTALGILDDYTIFQAFHAQASRYGSRELLNAEQVRKLSRLVAEAPKARLRPHAMMILADYYEKNNDPGAAKRLYDQVVQEYPDSPFEQTALQKLMNIALKVTDRAAAQKIFLRQWSDPVLTQIIYPGGAGWDLFVKDNIPPPAGSQWMIQETPGPDPEILEHQGPRSMVSEEVQQQCGLPAEIIPNRAE